MPSRRQSAAMLSSPRRPASTIPAFSPITASQQIIKGKNNKPVAIELSGTIDAGESCELAGASYTLTDKYGELGGTEPLNIAGDGSFMRFAHPADAIDCAEALHEAMQDLQLDIRAGVHLGDVELRDDGRIGGLSVHIGARVAALAEFERQQAELQAQQERLQADLQKQTELTNQLRKKREIENRDKMLLEETLMATIPQVNEANAICEELDESLSFSVKLMANPTRKTWDSKQGGQAGPGAGAYWPVRRARHRSDRYW